MKITFIWKVFVLLSLFMLSQPDTGHSADEWFRVTLTNVTFQKETIDFLNGTSKFISYKYSPTRDDMGIKGSFNEEQGKYEVTWNPPVDEGFNKRQLTIQVYLSGKYSSDMKITFLRYDFREECNNPQKPDDLGIHDWFLEASDIPYVNTYGNKMRFEAIGTLVETYIDGYSKVNQGNPRFRSIETVEATDSASKLTVELDIGDIGWGWFVKSPDIKYPRELDFGLVKVIRSDFDNPRTILKEIEVENVGNETLIINVCRASMDSGFKIISYPQRIDPGCSGKIVVGHDVDITVFHSVHKGQIQLLSNDPDEGTVLIDLRVRYIHFLITPSLELLLMDP